jgi:hypothetical protein
MSESPAGTEAAKPLIGNLVFLPSPEVFPKNTEPSPLKITVLKDNKHVPYEQDKMDGIKVDEKRVTLERKFEETTIELPNRSKPVTIRPVKIAYDDGIFEAFQITYPDYDEEGDPDLGLAVVGAREFPSSSTRLSI